MPVPKTVRIIGFFIAVSVGVALSGAIKRAMWSDNGAQPITDLSKLGKRAPVPFQAAQKGRYEARVVIRTSQSLETILRSPGGTGPYAKQAPDDVEGKLPATFRILITREADGKEMLNSLVERPLALSGNGELSAVLGVAELQPGSYASSLEVLVGSPGLLRLPTEVRVEAVVAP